MKNLKNSHSTTTILFNNHVGLATLVLVFVAFTILLYSNFFVVFDQTNVVPVPMRVFQAQDGQIQKLYTVYSEPYSIGRKIDWNDFGVQAIRKPYRFDKTCANFTKRLYQNGYFNLTALVSYPGSGNTWTRHLVELSTGIFTGSIYFDFELIAKGFLGEKEAWTSGTTIVQKTHEKFNRNSFFNKAILLIRDPYKTIVSFVQYLEVGHTSASSGHIFRKEGWENYTLGETFKWISLLKSWIEAPIPILVVHYEHLKEKSMLQFQMSEICTFLNVDCHYINSSCFRRHQEGEFHRKRKLPIVPPFPLWVRYKIDDGIDYLNDVLQRVRNELLPLSLYPYYRNYSGI